MANTLGEARNWDVLLTAETHNFPCAVAPYPGAETGAGGRIRDTHATGIGSIMGAAKINISGMQVGKTDVEGTNIMVLTIDNDVTADVIRQVTAIDGIFDAKLVNFYAV